MFRRFLRRLFGRFSSFLRLHPDVEPLIAGGFRLTNPLSAAYPSENLPFASRVIASGMWNYCFFQFYRHFAGPYWVERQYNPADPSFIPRASSMLSLNLTHRTWMGLRSPGGTRFSMVDPAGSFSPMAGSYSIEFAVREGSKLLLATRGDLKVKQKPFKDMPVAKTEYSSRKGFSATWIVAGCADQPGWVYSRIEYDAPGPCEIVIGIRPFNPEGAALITDLQLHMEPQGAVLAINKNRDIFLRKSPDEVRFSNLKTGDAYFESEPHGIVHCPHGIATGCIIYRVSGHGTIHFYARNDRTITEDIPLSFLANETEVHQSLASWERKIERGAKFISARGSWNKAARIFSGYVLSLQTGREITPGVFTYNQFWFRDAAYMVSSLTAWGFIAEAKAVLESYAERQSRDGFFKSHEGEWDSNGQAIWTLSHFIEHTGDLELLKKVYPAIRRGAQWIIKKRRQGPRRLILPAGFSAEHLGPADHYYWDNIWSIAGLLHAAHLAGLMGETKDENYFTRECDEYRRDLLEISSQERQKYGLITAAPDRPIDSGMIGNICAVYPLDLVLFPEDEMRRTVRQIHRDFFTHDLFFHPIIHSGYNIYLSLQMAQSHLRLGDVRQARRIFKRVLKSKSELWTYPEAIHPNTGGGVMGDGFHGWAFAEVLLLLREFVLHAQNGVLSIFRGLRNRELMGEFFFGPFPVSAGRVSISGSMSNKRGRIQIDFDRASTMRSYRIHVPGIRSRIADIKGSGCASFHFDRKKAIIEITGPTSEVEIELILS